MQGTAEVRLLTIKHFHLLSCLRLYLPACVLYCMFLETKIYHMLFLYHSLTITYMITHVTLIMTHSLYYANPLFLGYSLLSAFPYWLPTLTSHLVCPSRAWWTSGTFLGSSERRRRRGEATAGRCGASGAGRGGRAGEDTGKARSGEASCQSGGVERCKCN